MTRRWSRLAVVASALALSGCSLLIGLRDDYAAGDDGEAGTSEASTSDTGDGGDGGGRDALADGLAATCTNGVKDGTETAIDCGGDLCTPCANDKTCSADRDCISGACNAGACKPWLRSFGTQGANAGDGNAVAVSASGEIALCGTATVDVDFGGGTLAQRGAQDVVVAKLASNGTLLWARRFGGADTELCAGVGMDGAGNVVIGGTYFDAATFDLGDGGLGSVFGSEAFVAKLASATGAPLWASSIATNGVDRVYGIAVDPSGDVLATGQVGGQVNVGGNIIGPTNGTADIFVVKLASASGAATWAKSYGSTPGTAGDNGDDIGRAVTTDTKGNVFVTGSFRGTGITIGSTAFPSSGQHDAFVFALSPAGTALWATRYGSANPYLASGPEEGFGIATDDTGNVFVTGRTTTTNLTESFVAKLAPDGGLLWDVVRGGTDVDLGNAIAVDPAGNPLVVGRFNSPAIAFAPDASLANANAAGGRGDVFLVKLAGPDGRLLFAERYGGLELDNGLGVSARRGNSVVVGTAAQGMDLRGLPVTGQIFVGSLGPLP